MRIALATDAWHPQVNGVVRSLSHDRRSSAAASAMRSRSSIRRASAPSPVRPIRRSGWRLAAAGRSASYSTIFEPDRVHVSTEGPIGWAARDWCLKHGRRSRPPSTRASPTMSPSAPASGAEWIWQVMRRFHGAGRAHLHGHRHSCRGACTRRLSHTHHWPRGVDLEQFHPDGALHPAMANLPRPILLYVGRVAVEKNIEAFLDCQVEGSKVVVGDGPALAALQARYPEVLFLGAKHGAELASTYRTGRCVRLSEPHRHLRPREH